MNKRPRHEFEKIVMDEEMKKRILHNVLNTNLQNENNHAHKIKKSNYIKRSMVGVAACFTVIICLNVVKENPQLFNMNKFEAPKQEKIKDSNSEPEHRNSEEEITENNINDNESTVSQTGEADNNYNEDYEHKINKNEQSESQEHNNIEKNEKESDKSHNTEYIKDNSVENSDDSIKPSSETSNNVNTSETELPKGKNNSENSLNSTSESDKNGILQKKEKDYSADSLVEQSGFYIKDCETLEEAEKLANLKMNSIKELPDKFETENICVMSNELIQVTYVDDSEKRISFRAGRGNEYVSGDYNIYEFKNTCDLNGTTIKLEGNSDKSVNLAKWTKDDISYSISSNEGMDESEILNMIESSL